jgi:hypothetical protein
MGEGVVREWDPGGGDRKLSLIGRQLKYGDSKKRQEDVLKGE